MPIIRVPRPQIYRLSNSLSDYAGVILNTTNGYFWSIRHNAGIIQIFLEHNAVLSVKRCMQILPATISGMYKVDKSRIIWGACYHRLVPRAFGIIEGVVTSLCHASRLVYGAWICIMGESHHSGSAAGDQPGIVTTSQISQMNRSQN